MVSFGSFRRHSTRVAVGGLVGALSFVAPVKPVHAHRQTVVPRHCDSLAHVGDSLSFAARKQLAEQYARMGWSDVRIDAKGGRGIASFLYDDVTGIEAVRRIKASGFDGCWVMALGTNDTALTTALVPTAAGQRARRVALIRSMMAELGDAPVMWVNTHLIGDSGDYSNADAEAWNQALRDLIPEFPNMMIFDWDAAARSHPEWTSDDLIHDTRTGTRERAQMVAFAATMLLGGPWTAETPAFPPPFQRARQSYQVLIRYE